MEMVAFIERLPHSDSPGCTCPVIASFVRGINDLMGHEDRQKLMVYLPRLVGTVSPENEIERAEYLAWQAIRVFTPLALCKAGLLRKADSLSNFEGTLLAAADAADAAADAADADAADAAYAADAAADAADAAADAGARAAYAASAADAAARAAARAARAADAAAYAAARAASAADVVVIFNALDGLLAIGKQETQFEIGIEPLLPAVAKKNVG